MRPRSGRGDVASGTVASVQMEGELAAWLRAFEPAGAPMALRLRTSADLRAASRGRRSRLARLTPALLPVASLAAIVLLAGAVFFLAVVGVTSDRAVGGPGPGLQPSGSAGGLDRLLAWNVTPLVLLALAAAGLLGASVYVRPLRFAFGRFVFGDGSAPASVLLPLRRPLRGLGISRLTWALGIVAVALVAWSCWSNPPYSVAYVVATIVYAYPIAFAFAIALRYPRRDRSSRLMLAGAQILAAGWALRYAVTIATLVLGDYPGRQVASDVHFAVGYTISTVGWGALAAGIAARSGMSRRPRRILAAAAIGAPFLLVATQLAVVFGTSDGLPLRGSFVVLTVFGSASTWLVWVAWLAILWVGLTAALRHGGGLAWRLIAFAAAAYSVVVLKAILGWLALRQIPVNLDSAGWPIEECLVWGSLLLGLLVGLKPVDPVEPEAAEAAGDAGGEAAET